SDGETLDKRLSVPTAPASYKSSCCRLGRKSRLRGRPRQSRQTFSSRCLIGNCPAIEPPRTPPGQPATAFHLEGYSTVPAAVRPQTSTRRALWPLQRSRPPFQQKL